MAENRMEKNRSEENDVTLDLAAIAANAVEFCRRLVQIDTRNPYSGDGDAGSEAAGQAYIESIVQELGAAVTQFEPPADIYERMGVLGPKNRSFAGRPNLVSELTFGTGTGPRILIQGHIDTVGIAGMTIDPFSGRLEDGKIWGRGTSDMKGAMGAVLAALHEVVRRKDRLNGSILLMSVVDEECDGIGAGSMACMDRGYRGDVALSVDGGAHYIARGYGGVLTANVTVRGPGGHAAQPVQKDVPTAMERALNMGRRIMSFREKRWDEARAPANLGVFHSGGHPAVIPSDARLGTNITYTFSEANQAKKMGAGFGGALVRRRFETIVAEADPEAEVEWVKDGIPFETPADHQFVRDLAGAHERILGAEPEVKSVIPWTDACHLWYFGKMPTLVYGAGSPGQAHADAEYVEGRHVESCAKVIASYLYETLRSV